jgi:hypothetical protein
VATNVSDSANADERTGVDQLLCRNFPAFLRRDLGLELANLREAPTVSGETMKDVAEMLRTVSDGSASMTNLFCLRSCGVGKHDIDEKVYTPARVL